MHFFALQPPRDRSFVSAKSTVERAKKRQHHDTSDSDRDSSEDSNNESKQGDREDGRKRSDSESSGDSDDDNSDGSSENVMQDLSEYEKLRLRNIEQNNGVILFIC